MRRRERGNHWWWRESTGGADHLDDTGTGWCRDRQPVRHDPRRLIYYTVDGTTPTPASQQYQAPFLVASNLTVKAIAVSGASTTQQVSTVASQSFSANIPSGTLVWSDEFNQSTGAPTQPNPAVWTYDTGNSGFGNNELETYCAWGSSTSPCSTTNPSAYVGPYTGTDGVLYIVAQQPSPSVYTSARLKTQGLFSFQYGRIEFRALVPEAQGFWPANWLLGNNIATVNWPACGEQDVLERVNAATTPDWNAGSIHGPGFTGGTGLGHSVRLSQRSDGRGRVSYLRHGLVAG